MTGTQPSLLDQPVDVDRTKLPLDVRYADWLADHPGIIDVLADTARQLVAKGKRPTMNRCFEECRERVHTVGDEYAMNNSFRSFASRDVMELHPDLDGLFRIRKSKADR